MKRWIPLISSFALTVVLAAGLTLLDTSWNGNGKQDGGMNQRQAEQAPGISPLYLDSDNIVDVMTRTGLNGELARVQIKPQLLAVDVLLSAQTRREDMLLDFAELARLSFHHTENIHQLLVRVLTTDQSGKELLLASWEAERSVWLELGEKENVTASRIIPAMNGFYLTKAGEDFFKP
ncbi:hypothetical protein DUZ99_10780 [Xylanibacillus composti]|uniref:Uncharacterized protein n=1 Tax=Xylanibacillus composti TaxID=1572762 RepID=A0A8J4GYH7_9BACL|nr:hypothetical protein [Xylanibacillus composti]MDT9725454.1 hypothetical protein [Xylanibacillus composti]GIQ67547.1 hypothetical protein XYCOK13_03710 [Xylanibacillus composti]